VIPAGILGSLMISLPLVLVLMHRALAPLLIVAGFAALFLPGMGDWLRGLRQARPGDAGPVSVLCLAGFCAYTALSGLWAPLEGRVSLGLNVGVPALAATTLATGLARNLARSRAVTLRLIYQGAIMVAALGLAFEAATGAALRDIVPPTDDSWFRHKDWAALGRGTTALIVLSVPAMVMLGREARWRGLAVLVAMLTAWGAWRFGISANLLAFGAALGAMAGAMAVPRAMVMAVAGLWLGALVTAPLMAYLPAEAMHGALEGQVPPSAIQRLYTWQTLGALVPAGLPWGHGADAARAFAETAGTVELSGAYGPLKIVPTHPHNVFLQIWLELGVPGVLLAAGAIISAAAAVLLRAPLTRPAMTAIAGILAASWVSFLVEASLWQVWRLSAIGLALAACGLIAARENAAR